MSNSTGSRLRSICVCSLLAAGAAFAQPKEPCLEGCHQDLQGVEDAKHKKLTCGECHPNVKDGKADHAEAMTELPPEQSCALAACHPTTAQKQFTGPHKDSTCDSCHGALHDKFEYANYGECKRCHKEVQKAWEVGIHLKTAKTPVTCANCHGDVHEVKSHQDPMSPVSKWMQPTTCGECHDNEYVRAFRTSVHGKGLLRSGLVVAPTCSDCHGAHDIVKTKDKASKVSAGHITQTCGTCHEFIMNRWKHSTHGELAQKTAEATDGGVLAGPRRVGTVAPVCSNCHPGHLTFDPTIYGNHLKMADKCGQCHPTQAESYRDSFHGKATRLGFEVAATCADCHTPHEMLPEDNPKSSVNPKNLQATCARCHPGASASFIQFEPHLNPREKTAHPAVHYVWLFMTLLLVGVLGFFGVHTLLWLQRSIVAMARKEFHHSEWAGQTWVRRFKPVHRYIHLAIIVTFLSLAATGLPLKLSYMMGWVQPVSQLFGGLGLARWLHRLAGVLTFGYGAVYLGWLIREVGFRKRRELLFGWRSLVPGVRDAKDLLANLKWFLYLGERPQLDRWAYWEKFDFLAVFWGIPIIGFSGLMLWAPVVTTNFLPGWVLNIAYLIHSDEALLATGFIFFFHFFHTHLRPEAFPLDPVIFLGGMPLERFKADRPTEYARLLESGELEQLFMPAPTEREMRRAYRIGYVSLFIGVVLGAFLLFAGFTAVWK